VLTLESKYLEFEGHRLHWLEAGEGPAVVLLHGWPTSAFLYRNIGPAIAAKNRVLIPDLIGFGKSDKPLDVSYSFRFHERILSAWLDAIGVDDVGLCVHDLGGPVGLYWACMHPERIRSLALLNTLVYPRPSWAVVAFVIAAYTPFVRMWLTSPSGLDFAMDYGTCTKRKLADEVYEGVRAPFPDKASRRALLKAAVGLSPKGMMDIARILPTFDVPVRCIYGEQDRILPDVARTMKKVKEDLPQAEITALRGCGHFLQEERSDEIGELLAAFFA
jgi:pimeloyl-ACP methyl ester carboxylesterase